MGWEVQGYYYQNSRLNSGRYWHVNSGNGEVVKEIKNFNFKKINLDNYTFEILYGTSGLEFFRGYLLIDSIDTAKDILSSFNQFKVYKTKHYGENIFDVSNLEFAQLSYNFIIFYERRRWTKDEWNDMKSDLIFRLEDCVDADVINQIEHFYK